MSMTAPLKKRLQALKMEFDALKMGKDSLLAMIDETEIPESVYNSNAIENSTLTLKETEKILLEMEVSRKVSVREVFEAKNLARVVVYMRQQAATRDLNKDTILFLHDMLITGINDVIAGRFRVANEYVQVGKHIAPAPERVEQMMSENLRDYSSSLDEYFLEKITKFHLQFEYIHPFIDGNGRIGRVLLNWQLQQLDLPPIVIRDKEKQLYYAALQAYDDNRQTKLMEKILYLALSESFHKRIAYLQGDEIITLADYARTYQLSAPATFNAARRQNLPAFRERGVWKIGVRSHYTQ